MVIERVELDINPGKEADFLHHCDVSRPLFATIRGCTSFRFGRGIENPSKIILLVGWDSVDAHDEARASGALAPFVAGLAGMLAGTPVMEHFAIAE